MASRDETEPDAQKRRAASELWQMFVALTKEGFSEHQALVVIGQILAGGMKEKG
jgi:hypothetical protein